MGTRQSPANRRRARTRALDSIARSPCPRAQHSTAPIAPDFEIATPQGPGSDATTRAQHLNTTANVDPAHHQLQLHAEVGEHTQQVRNTRIGGTSHSLRTRTLSHFCSHCHTKPACRTLKRSSMAQCPLTLARQRQTPTWPSCSHKIARPPAAQKRPSASAHLALVERRHPFFHRHRLRLLVRWRARRGGSRLRRRSGGLCRRSGGLRR